MPYRLATPQYVVNEGYYITLYSKKQAILMLFTKIEEVLVCQKVTKRLPFFYIIKLNEPTFLPYQLLLRQLVLSCFFATVKEQLRQLYNLPNLYNKLNSG